MPAIEFQEVQERRERKARRLSPEELAARAAAAPKVAGQRQTTATSYERDQYVSRFAKERAKGCCELCAKPAPFKKSDGEPYLETHHVTWLSKGGEDSIANTVALCPNCHRKMHELDADLDRAKLTAAIAKGQSSPVSGFGAIEAPRT